MEVSSRSVLLFLSCRECRWYERGTSNVDRSFGYKRPGEGGSFYSPHRQCAGVLLDGLRWRRWRDRCCEIPSAPDHRNIYTFLLSGRGTSSDMFLRFDPIHAPFTLILYSLGSSATTAYASKTGRGHRTTPELASPLPDWPDSQSESFAHEHRVIIFFMYIFRSTVRFARTVFPLAFPPPPPPHTYLRRGLYCTARHCCIYTLDKLIRYAQL